MWLVFSRRIVRSEASEEACCLTRLDHTDLRIPDPFFPSQRTPKKPQISSRNRQAFVYFSGTPAVRFEDCIQSEAAWENPRKHGAKVVSSQSLPADGEFGCHTVSMG